ncbi:unnamed protein product, partial [Rotaria magnacalcarata]
MNTPISSVRFRDIDSTKFITQPKYALVEFPNSKLDFSLSELEPKLIPIPNPTKSVKDAKKFTKVPVRRKALPLIPAYSITTHKSQGQTLGKVIIDLVTPPGPVAVVSVYVPLSRVKRLDDLLIIRPFEYSAMQVKPSSAQTEELKRLDRIAETTRKQFPPK